MSVDAEQIQDARRWTLKLSPRYEETLEEQRAWYVNLDDYDFQGKKHRTRGPPAGLELRLAILAAVGADAITGPVGNQSAQLLAGYRGTGKTTELQRLERSLTEEGFQVYLIDMEEYVNKNAAPSAEEVALGLVIALDEHAKNRGQRGLGADLLGRAADFIRRIGIEPPEVNLGAMKAKLKIGDPSFRTKIAEARNERPRLKALLHERIRTIIAERGGASQVAILVDGPEKIYTDVGSVNDEYQRLARVFADDPALWSLPGCHVVYVVPPFISTYKQGIEHGYGALVHLAHVKVFEKRPPDLTNRRPDEVGRAALTEIAGHRVNLKELFGADNIQVCMDPILTASGGTPRRMFQILSQVVKRAIITPLPLSMVSVQESLDGMRSVHEMLPASTLQAMIEVANCQSLAGLSPLAQEGLAHAMDEYLILSYYNGQPWFDVTPSRWELMEQVLAFRAAAPASR